MIDIRKLKELVKLMVENDLSELDLRDEQETVVVKRGLGHVPAGARSLSSPGNHSPGERLFCCFKVQEFGSREKAADLPAILRAFARAFPEQRR